MLTLELRLSINISVLMHIQVLMHASINVHHNILYLLPMRANVDKYIKTGLLTYTWVSNSLGSLGLFYILEQLYDKREDSALKPT